MVELETDWSGLAMPKRVLIVDDSPTMRQMVSFTLREANFDVLEAENGQEALKKVQGEKFDLILTDLNMPIMDGITFIRNARGLAATKYVPILMLTTESQAEKKAEGKSAGATGWIVKPFDPPKLLAVIGKVLL
jgi:two-component system chemotaxis response regulator CheY